MIILASKSPRRREILGRFFRDFKVIPSEAEERSNFKNPVRYAMDIARKKAWEVYEREGGTVIGADTIVVLKGRILGKPRDEEEAISMLKELSGEIHEVITGYCIIHEGREISNAVITRVKFRELNEEEIKAYVKTGEPLDKAGAYGIQGKGSLLVRGVEGDYYNVVGFPMEIIVELEKLGFNPWKT